MDLWDSYLKEASENDFGTSQIILNTGDRHNSSLKRYFDRGIELKPNAFMIKQYSYDKRYIRCIGISYDLLITIFDVNTCDIFVSRISKVPSKKEFSDMLKDIKKMNENNLELRLIGLQNNHLEITRFINTLHSKINCKVAEVDLFGKELRNILIDTKTGMLYNLLLENRIYRPGELINKIAFEDFESANSTKLIPNQKT
ncbi:MAG: hypothetical protein ACP5M9_02495 [Candidatus Micrarchaeia archaeon]